MSQTSLNEIMRLDDNGKKVNNFELVHIPTIINKIIEYMMVKVDPNLRSL